MTNNKDYKKHLIRLIIIFVVLLFYIWTTTEGYFTFSDRHYYRAYYNALASAFSFGRLDLNIVVPPKLKNLKDPYNYDVKNDPDLAGFFDFSYYKEKFYLYFGPTPAITLILPYHWIIKSTKLDEKYNLNYFVTFPPSGFVVLFYMFSVFIWAVLLLLHLKNKYFKDTPEWMFLLSILVIAFCNIGGYLLRRPFIYEIAVSCGCFFTTSGIYFLCLGISSLKNKTVYFLLGSLLLGLSVGARINVILVGLIVIFFLIIMTSTENFSRKFKFKLSKEILALTIPFILCISTIAYYNYARFNNIFETGYNYQIGCQKESIKDYRNIISSPRRLAKHIYFYLFKPILINNKFPFIHIENPYDVERIASIFACIPFTLLTVFSLFFYVGEKFKKDGQSQSNIIFPKIEFGLLLLPVCILLVFFIIFSDATMRYYADYLTLLLIATCIIWYYYNSKSSTNSKYNCFLNSTVTILAFISIVFGISFSIVGSQIGLESQNPDLYKNLESIFRPVSNIILYLTTLF